MIFRSRAPLRLGFAGGGTDLSPYSDNHGGAVLNATIDLYAYATLEIPAPDGRVHFSAIDGEKHVSFDPVERGRPTGDDLQLHWAVYNRIVNQFCNGRSLSCRLTTYCEAPPGSGLGSSSTLVVAMTKAFAEALALPLGEYDLAFLAYEIERLDAGLMGGRQDQYAAAFGGVNFIEFFARDRVIVNPLRVKKWILAEIESSLVLFYTGVSRASARIIEEQTANIADTGVAVQAMHQLKRDAFAMKEAVLKGDISRMADVMNSSWRAKQKTAAQISTAVVEEAMHIAFSAGARAAKVSGAGGGGFLTLLVNPVRRMELIRALEGVAGRVVRCSLTKNGAEGWRLE